MQAELDIYQRLRQAPRTAAIAARAYFAGDVIIRGQSHPYMVMQRLGRNLEAVACSGLATTKFVQVRRKLSCDVYLHNYCLTLLQHSMCM